MTKPHSSKELKLLCIGQKVLERLLLLRRTGGAGILLADKADGIIAKLESGMICQIVSKIGTRTLYGEKRIRKCVKYDLGYGYRLVTVRRGDCLFITYLGTHDECDRWLAEHSRSKDFRTGKEAVYRTITETIGNESGGCNQPTEGPDYLDDRLKNLRDGDLQRIFCGLVEARKRHRASIHYNT